MPRVRYKSPERMTNQSGVYLIINLHNGKIYVGSSANIRGRIFEHLKDLRRGCHHNRYLQRAWDKYGEGVFRFEVLETCPTGLIIQREQYWMDNLDSSNPKIGYNLVAKAGGGWSQAAIEAGTKAAAKVNRGKKRSIEVRVKISIGNKGKKRSEETKAKVKANHWSRKPNAAEIAEKTASKNRGRKHSTEHKEKISKSHWKNRADADLIRAKVSEACRGRRFTRRQRLNIAIAAARRKKSMQSRRIASLLQMLEDCESDGIVHGTTS